MAAAGDTVIATIRCHARASPTRPGSDRVPDEPCRNCKRGRTSTSRLDSMSGEANDGAGLPYHWPASGDGVGENSAVDPDHCDASRTATVTDSDAEPPQHPATISAICQTRVDREAAAAAVVVTKGASEADRMTHRNTVVVIQTDVAAWPAASTRPRGRTDLESSSTTKSLANAAH